MTGPTGPEGQPEPFRGTEYPSLEDSAGHPPDPNAPVEYPADPGLPPPIYPAPYPGVPGYPGAPGYPPAPGYYPGAGYDPYRPMKPPGTNGKAIAALVCSVSGFMCCLPAIPGLILGIAAMRETKRTGQDGYALALAGTVLGGLMVVGMLLYVLVIIGLYASGWQWV